MVSNEFGAYLKQLRKAKGLTMKEISDSVGVSHPYISQLENGRGCVVSSEVIRKLSTALGVTHIGMMIKAGHVTEDEVLTFRKERDIYD